MREGHADRAEAAVADDGVSDIRQPVGATAGSDRMHRPPTGGSTPRMERVATSTAAPGRPTVPTAALLRPIRRESCGRRSGGSYETGFWLIPSAAAPKPERISPTHSRQQTCFTPLPPLQQYALNPAVRRPTIDGSLESEYAYFRTSDG